MSTGTNEQRLAGAAAEADGRASILLVDDHPPNLVALKAILEPLGEQLVTAASGREALMRVLDHQFAVILMDVQMPDMDGLETVALLKKRKRSRDIPVIFLTALSRDAAHVFKGYEYGAVDYLLKPFDPGILRAKVAVFVELYKQREQIQRQQLLLREREREVLEKRSEHRVRSIIDAMPHCVWATRADGVVHYCNRVWLEYSGQTFVEATSGHAIFEHVHPDDRAAADTAFHGALHVGDAFEMQYRLRAADGSYRWHLLRASPERDEGGEIAGWIVTATDIDAQKRAEDARVELFERERAARAEAEQARRDAEAANRTKDEFLATVSHELRTPLNAILGWTRMLRGDTLPPEKRTRALETIERNATVQTQIIEDILDVSRIITGKLRLEFQPVDLTALVEAAADAVRPTADARGVEVEIHLEATHARVAGDPDRLQQVLWNLLSNAIKFTPRGGHVEVRLAQVESHFELRVTDTGQGIHREFLPYVFDRFRQADSTTARAHGGLGLGLAIVRHLVELHGGTVAAESEGAGRGATFMVMLPIRAVQAAPPPPESAPQSRGERAPVVALPSIAGLHVLAVDDEPDARELIAEALAQQGARVTTAGSVDDALAALTELRPDVLVSDIGMPGQDGYTLIRRVRALDPEQGGQVPAAALTAYARADDRLKVLGAGFQAHMAKPVNPAELVAVVGDLAGRSTRQTEPDDEARGTPAQSASAGRSQVQ